MSLITVIVNTLNGAGTLPDAIESVLAQTFADWELILWDDCSSDNSAEVAARYTDDRIRYVRSKNLVPLGVARQRAMELASGEWIAFLDQDDVWVPHKLEQQISVASVSIDVGLVYGRTVRFYPDGTECDYDQAHEYTPLPEGDIFADLFIDSCFIAMSSAMFRRSAIELIDRIPDRFALIPDYYLYTAIARRFPVVAVQEVVCRYRMHSSNTSRVNAMQVQQEALALIETWEGALDSRTLALCGKRHSTAIALLEMSRPRTLFLGLWRLLTQGSAVSQLLRPFYFVFHLLRRSAKPPLWKTLDSSRRPTYGLHLD